MWQGRSHSEVLPEKSARRQAPYVKITKFIITPTQPRVAAGKSGAVRGDGATSYRETVPLGEKSSRAEKKNRLTETSTKVIKAKMPSPKQGNSIVIVIKCTPSPSVHMRVARHKEGERKAYKKIAERSGNFELSKRKPREPRNDKFKSGPTKKPHQQAVNRKETSKPTRDPRKQAGKNEQKSRKSEEPAPAS